MALPKSGGRADIVVQVEWDPVGAAGTYTAWCGANNVRFEVANETKGQKVGDCEDWSAPVVELTNYSGQSVRVNIDATWTSATSSRVMDWALNQKKLNVRLQVTSAESGEIEFYDGLALISGTTLDAIGNTEGDTITDTVTLVFDGGVTPTAKA